MANIQDIIDRAATVGIKASAWAKGDKLRIYAKTDRRDMSVYLELEGDADRIEGGSLKVFCNTNQHPNWIASQVRQYREIYMPLFWSYVVEHYKETDPELDGYGSDINDMIDQARAFFVERETADNDDTDFSNAA